jgi:cell division protein FtsZ
MAISNPLLDDVSMKGAKGVLINITGGPDLMLFEVEQAANRIRAEVDPDANIIFGNTILDDMEGRIRVSVVATGIEADLMRMPKVTPIRANIKPQVFTVDSPRPVAAANPVRDQVAQLMTELNAPPPAPVSADEAYILGGDDAPAITETYPATETLRSSAEMPLAPQKLAEADKKGWGFFGRKKPATPDLRAEPVVASRAAPRQAQAPAAQASSGAAAPPSGEDLFPEHNRDEQFEIPAFLRRQSN